ncbi:hypothetical protein [Brevundimonas sp. FT23042]|uniref:hypothetical protein n=1 Tax=Brevundimonas sp. FT23042 TaxID=3393749 RepID=UPI003B5862BB
MLALVVATPASATPYSWREVADTVASVARAFASKQEDGGRPAGAAYGFDIRRICQDDQRTFIATVESEGCDEGGCSGRREALARMAAELAEAARPPLQDMAGDAQARMFVPQGLELDSSTTVAAEILKLRAAHDLLLRGWMDPLTTSQDVGDHDRWLLLTRSWCGVTRSNAEFVASYLGQYGFSKDRRGEAAAVVNIAIHSAWDPSLTRPIRAAVDPAFDSGDLPGYYAAQIIDIDAMANEGGQRIGTLHSCSRGLAYPDPPILDPEAAPALRRRLGLSSLPEWLSARSRNCAP